MARDDGAAGVVREALNGAAAEIARAQNLGEQIPLFDLPGTEGLAAVQLQRIDEAKRGPGRPQGSPNLSNKQLREYLLARGVSPLQQLMEWGQHTPQTLATVLGCTPLEALRELRIMWAELAPYLAAKMVPVDDAGRAVPSFLVQIGGATRGSVGGVAPWLDESEQNQSLSVTVDGVSHASVSHEGAK